MTTSHLSSNTGHTLLRTERFRMAANVQATTTGCSIPTQISSQSHFQLRCQGGQGGQGTTIVVAAFFKEIDIDKNGASHQQALLLGSGTVWESDVERIGLSKNLNAKGLGGFENLSNVRSIAVRLLLAGREDMEWNLATTPATARISFGATVDATTSAARWRVDLVNRIATRCLDLERRHAKEAIFLHAAEFLSTRCDSGLLVAAAFATAKGAAEWTVDGDHLGLCVGFLMERRIV